MSPNQKEATPHVIKYQRPRLAQYQLDAIFCAERYSVIEASTKAGKTIGCLAWIIEMSMVGKAGQNFWWVAPIRAQAKIAFSRVKTKLTKGSFITNESELTIALRNGAVIWFKSADNPDSLYGEDVFAAVFDEASRAKEEAWFALRSTLTATKAPVRIIGNVKGRKNWFYKIARRAETKEPGMKYAKITAYDAVAAGVLDAAEIEDARKILPEHVFNELYLAVPSEDGSNPFGFKYINACVNEGLSHLEVVSWGIDLAKSSDYTVIIGLDEFGDVAYFNRFQKSWKVTIAEIKQVVGREVPCLVDSTGVGDPIVEELQAWSSNFEGYKFNQHSKQQLMEGLAVAIQHNEIGYPDGRIRIELEAFEYEYTRTGVRYSAPTGEHDDCVCALALAKMKHVVARRTGGAGSFS